MEFNPSNTVVNLCLAGMDMEAQNNSEEASRLFLQAWHEATNDFEKFIAAYYVARHQVNVADRLEWLEFALQFALKINDAAVKAAFPSMYSNIAQCHEALGNAEKAKENHELANSFSNEPSDEGPFYHGTKADFQVGDLLTAGNRSNYKTDVIIITSILLP